MPQPDSKAAPTGTPTATSTAAPVPTAITSLDDLIERAEDRIIPKGSTVHVSANRPDLKTPGQIDELEDSLRACGIALVRENDFPPDKIVVDPPANAKK